jgi:hypothetical protein
MQPVIGADFARECCHRPGFGSERFVIPALDRRTPENHPCARNRMTPLLGGQFLKLGLQLAAGGRRRQKRANDAEAKMRPVLMGSRV